VFRSRRPPRIAKAAVAGLIALVLLGIAACSGSRSSGGVSAPSPGVAALGGTATVALPAGVTPNYIFPFIPNADANAYNQQGFEELMFRPLYYIGGNNDSVAINYPLSTADAPVYTGGGKTVTITMKGWKWSDGETVGAADLVFWLNMMKAERTNFYGYVPGLIPDNLASYSATGPETVVLHLTSPVSRLWFTYNQLAELTPIPLAWDISKAGGAPGSGGCIADSAKDKWAC
jgi:peptide/nickel transport system substrate-binding protein